MTSAHPGGEEQDRTPPRHTGRRAHRHPAAARRRERTREALLEAAQRLWAEGGIHATSLDDIATAAGLTKGAVYSNFAGKADLAMALLERCTAAGFGTEAPEPPHEDGGRPPLQRLRHLGERYRLRLETAEARLLALLMMEFWLLGMRDYAAGWRLADWYDERRRRLARGLPGTDGITPEDRAALVMAMDFGLTAQHLLDPDRVPADLYATGLNLLLGPPLHRPSP
ncbi:MULTISPECIES: TetR/AcrR family transcriptional regulator [Thermomonospora]|uniref:Transcriptional regulator, TetR family n=1 Tax=Thermomonospora curvata (strain ATCC 19995 / DSM 43183 / JCM 3096 / KCTC 9072 / NBRC 15933 / NCIMB 10081 / Henssen B9) TaxID=471852 RepID=D1A307_THECD|nr:MULTISPECIES: TetR/AcrR family transcriptional regulator [Thermomonospora]ACY99777.1 transcriptional regulator, TetR family [Thermomonospora curvata DSM 43183]PKK12783.1 MAG: TetR/AcrR family transcriptional regulator [Thermomonospora sp. CIF 1]